MSRSRITILTTFLAWPLNGPAQQVGWITDYLKPIVSNIAADPNVGGWMWETNGNGGYLLWQSMDVTGDGKPEFFVASTLLGSRHAQSWTVFDVTDDGNLRPYKTVLDFSSAWPVVENDQISLVFIAGHNQERMRLSEEKYISVYRYAFAFPEIKTTLTYFSELEVAKLSSSHSVKRPKLQAILLADYLTKPDAKWTAVTEWHVDSSDCFYLPEDKERSAKNIAFTPKVALSRLEELQSSSQVGIKSDTRAQKPRQVVYPTAPQNEFKAKAEKSSLKETPSIMPWIMSLVLISASFGLLWKLLKQR